MARRITNRMSQLLTERNMTQKELALSAGITESAVSHYIKGDRVPRGVNLIKIAKALGTTTDDLLGNDEGKQENDFKTIIKFFSIYSTKF